MQDWSTRNTVLMWLRLLGLFCVSFVVKQASASFNLTILHTNDIHCRFEEANKLGGACKQRDSEDGNCFGGYARLVHQARKIREQHPDTIFLNGGDFFQGTMWEQMLCNIYISLPALLLLIGASKRKKNIWQSSRFLSLFCLLLWFTYLFSPTDGIPSINGRPSATSVTCST